MPARASNTSAKAAFGPYSAGDGYSHDELWPGERIGPPPRRRRGRALLRGALLLVVFGGGWALLSGRVTWPDWRSLETTAASWMGRLTPSPAPVERASLVLTATPATAPPVRPVAVDAAPTRLRPSASSDAAAGPGATERSAALPPAAAAGREEPQAEPLPPPVADPADPYRIRAEAVGLHPDLSRVLLDRLSEADYRNAGIAVRTALAQTPDGGELAWPRQRKPELALFRVRFVQGAASGCRRYVVTITKDGWLTTALPMEKCGTIRAGRGAGKLASP